MDLRGAMWSVCIGNLSEMPSIPILVNKRALKKHIQLLVFQRDKQKEDNNKVTEHK